MEWEGGEYAYEGGVLITDRSGKQIGIGNLENCLWDDEFTETLIGLIYYLSSPVLFILRDWLISYQPLP